MILKQNNETILVKTQVLNAFSFSSFPVYKKNIMADATL